MTLSLEEIKQFMRIQHSEEDTFLSSLILSSEQWIKNATHKEADTNSDLFKLAQQFLITHWYENRDQIGKAEGLKFHLESILVQISYTTSDLL